MVSKSKSLMKDYSIGTKIHVLYDALDSSKFIVKELNISYNDLDIDKAIKETIQFMSNN